MIWVFVLLVLFLYFSTHNSKKPFGCLGAIIVAFLIMAAGAIAIALGFTGFFPF